MEYVLNFLMGLNDSYSQIKGQILLIDPLPLIAKVFPLILQGEKQTEIKFIPQSHMAFVVQKDVSKDFGDSKQCQEKKHDLFVSSVAFHVGLFCWLT